jgi:hypothetical protein
MLNGESKVGQGQLYASGNPTYDAYFRDVHQQQVDASAWGDERRGIHKGLVTSLSLTPDAPDVTLVQAAHDASSKVAKQAGSVRLDVDGTNARVATSGGVGDASGLFRAVEDTSHQELERARRLHGVEPKLDALSKQGTDLNTHVKADFAKYNDAKVNQVTAEIAASLEVLGNLKSRAQAEARASEDFVADLERALETASEDKVAKREGGKRKKRRDDAGSPAKAAAQESVSPKAAPSESTSAKAATPPAPKPADTGEVFTP